MAQPSATPSTPRKLADRVAAWARAAAESFRRQDRFFKMRAGIVGAWALLSTLTLLVVCPSGASNPLGADVRVLRDSLVGGEQILVRNESGEIWEDVRLTLDGAWRFDRKTMRPNDQLVVAVRQFRREGQPPPRDFRPRSLTIECEQGRHTVPLR